MTTEIRPPNMYMQQYQLTTTEAFALIDSRDGVLPINFDHWPKFVRQTALLNVAIDIQFADNVAEFGICLFSGS